jgi:hypothetical protein
MPKKKAEEQIKELNIMGFIRGFASHFKHGGVRPNEDALNAHNIPRIGCHEDKNIIAECAGNVDEGSNSIALMCRLR